MTGLVSSAPSAANLGALLGSAGIAPAKTGAIVGSISINFLDFLGLLGDDLRIASSEDPPPAESSHPETAIRLTELPDTTPPAAPKQIADALIRSMLKGLKPTPSALPKADAAPTLTATVAPPTASPTPVPKKEDWDIPLDWVAPEELAESGPMQDDLPVVDLLSFISTLGVTPPTKPASVPMSGITLRAAEAAPEAPVMAALPQKALNTGRTPPPVGSSVPERTAPLVFAMKLLATVQDPKTEVPALRAAASGTVPLAAPLLAAPPLASAQEVSIEHVVQEAVPKTGEKIPIQAVTGKEQGQAAPLQSAVDASSDKREPEQRESKPEPERAPDPRTEAKIPSPRVESVLALPQATHAAAVGAPITTEQAQAFSTKNVETAPLPNRGAPSPAELASPPARAGAAHEIDVRISAPDTAPVDVQVKQRGGEVQVAVRTADGGLQTSLRQDLDTLVARLEHTGFRTETIVPQESPSRIQGDGPQNFTMTSSFRAHAMEQSARSSGNSDNSNNGESSGRQQHSSDSGARQQQQQRRQNSSQHLEWIQAMEDQV